MNIKELREKINLTQREFGERLGVQPQTVLKWEKGDRKVPEGAQKLIRYEFAEYLPEEERLSVHLEAKETPAIYGLAEEVKKENEYLKRELESQKKITALLEDQVAMYKNDKNLLLEIDDKLNKLMLWERMKDDMKELEKEKDKKTT